MKLKVILTGATGMVGEGVLLECLEHPEVEKVLMVNRKHFDLEHPKLEECLVPDFFQLDQFEKQLTVLQCLFFLCRRQFCGNERAGVSPAYL